MHPAEEEKEEVDFFFRLKPLLISLSAAQSFKCCNVTRFSFVRSTLLHPSITTTTSEGDVVSAVAVAQ